MKTSKEEINWPIRNLKNFNEYSNFEIGLIIRGTEYVN